MCPMVGVRCGADKLSGGRVLRLYVRQGRRQHPQPPTSYLWEEGEACMLMAMAKMGPLTIKSLDVPEKPNKARRRPKLRSSMGVMQARANKGGLRLLPTSSLYSLISAP